MAVNLNATLKAALDGSSHKPICKIVSTSLTGDIPFDGNLFNSSTVNESEPDLVALASGRLAVTYKRVNDLYLIYSDTDRTTWTEALLYDGDAGYTVADAALIELANGNLGVVFMTLESGAYRLFQMIIGPTGAIVSAAAQIASYSAASYVIDSPALCQIATGFLLVYKYQDVGAGTYSLYKRTADANFANWSTEAALSLSGLISSREKNHPALLAAASGRKYLFFDYVDDVADDNERQNIFFCYSTDNGATWSAPAALTAYGDFSAPAIHPDASEKPDADIVIAYHEKASVLTINSNTAGFCTADGGHTDTNLVSGLHFDPASGYLFVQGSWPTSGGKKLERILVIDTATWTIDRCYKQDGSPGFNALWTSWDAYVMYHTAHGDGQYFAIPTNGGYIGNATGILLVNHQSQTIREYWFNDYATYGITKNVDVDLGNAGDSVAPFIDAAAGRLYVCGFGEYALKGYIKIGYMDLNDTGDPITRLYQFNEICSATVEDGEGGTPEQRAFRVYPAEDKIVLSAPGSEILNTCGMLWVWVLSTGSLLKAYNYRDDATFPWLGVHFPVLIENVIYASVYWYETTHGQAEHRGLCLIDLSDDTITFERPTYATVDDYGLRDLKPVEDGARIIAASDHGVVFYDIIARTWTCYNTDNVPGMFSDGEDYTAVVAYDEANDVVFTAHNDPAVLPDDNLVAFVEAGAFYRGKYLTGALQVDDSYQFSAPANLHLTTGGHDVVIAHDASGALWAVWTHLDVATAQYCLMWDRDSFTPDVAGYILAGAPVKVQWEIGKVALVEFTLARGDLFDPTNTASIYAPLFKKGRLVQIYFGEKVAGVDYFQQQGAFIVTGAALTYSRPDHPTVTITAEDRATTWDDIVATATAAYQAETVNNLLADLLEDFAGLTSTEYDIPDLSNAHGLYCQWVDQTLQDIVDDITNHFGVFGHWRTDGVFTLKQINLEAAVDHDYSSDSHLKIISYSPDDRFSSFINRVVVKCEGRQFLEVLWDEERIASLNGTVGFWSKEDTITVYFSDDRTRRCKYPRLDVIQSINDYSPLIKLLGGNGDEYIQSLAADQTYCIVQIEAPNRALYVFGFAAAVAGFGAGALGCDADFTCGVFILLTNLALSALIQTISAEANYRYDVYARPLGDEKQMYQAQADDTDLQNQLAGQVVSQDIEDPLAYTVAHCQMVANHELAVVKAQRNRISFEKVAHLQDEVGDIVTIKHPVSDQAVDVYVARLVRTFTRPQLESGDGRFADQIEGWRLK